MRIQSPPFLALLLATTLSAQSAKTADPLAAYLLHGVSHPLAIWRANTVRDVRYDLSLDVTAPDSAVGHVTVRFSRTGASDAILDWRASPLLAPSLHGVPPALIIAAACDPLCDEGAAYVRRLEEAGVAVDYRRLDGMVHGFLTMGGKIDAANRAVALMAAALKQAFETS